MILLKSFLSVLVLFHLVGCVSSRTVVPRVGDSTKEEPEPQVERPPITVSQAPRIELSPADELTVELLVQRANALFSKGEVLVSRGQTEDGRRYFLESLEALSNFQFNFFNK